MKRRTLLKTLAVACLAPFGVLKGMAGSAKAPVKTFMYNFAGGPVLAEFPTWLQGDTGPVWYHVVSPTGLKTIKMGFTEDVRREYAASCSAHFHAVNGRGDLEIYFRGQTYETPAISIIRKSLPTQRNYP